MSVTTAVCWTFRSSAVITDIDVPVRSSGCGVRVAVTTTVSGSVLISARAGLAKQVATAAVNKSLSPPASARSARGKGAQLLAHAMLLQVGFPSLRAAVAAL